MNDPAQVALCRLRRVVGTHGMLEGDGVNLTYQSFVTDEVTTIDTSKDAHGEELGAHGGGDGRLVQNFVEAVAIQNASKILSGPKEALETHLMVFAAERARREDAIVDIEQ